MRNPCVRFGPTPSEGPLSADLCVFISTILKGLGLEGKLTSEQIAKKWDNLRTKYKVGCDSAHMQTPTSAESPLLKMLFLIFKM